LSRLAGRVRLRGGYHYRGKPSYFAESNEGIIVPVRRLIRTTNGFERVNRELKRRTRVVGIFPHPAACLRLVTAVAIEISDE
jgi:transposase-like protein